ncbi:MAG: cation:proton antiporter [Desulfamplus sp.]|nr:cation:proton antiporter [Desulfamplus sp.]
MEKLTPHNIMLMLLSLGILLGVARILGEIAQRFRQPAVVGELLAGVLLGPTVLGSLAPGLGLFLFPPGGPNAIALDAISTLAIVLFLMVAGIEVDLSTIWKQGKVGLKVGIASIVIPFVFGFFTAWFIPQALGKEPDVDQLVFALFIATAMSISALPVIAKTLMDMDLYRSDLGMVVVSAAIFNDIVGWIVFAVVLGLMGGAEGSGNHILLTILMTLAFALFMLTAGRWLIHKVLPFVQAYTRWPGGELSFALILALFGASFTEWIGIHAIFGAFLVGAAIGDSSHLRERTRVTIDHFVSFIFAPVFFASIGLKVNFIAHFDLPLVFVVMVIVCTFKLTGGTLGARWGGMSPRSSLTVGFAMLSVGAMGIIVGLLALEAGIINHRLFVALVVVAIITSMTSGPAMRLVLKPAKTWRLEDALFSRLFIRKLNGVTRRDVINEVVEAACKEFLLDQNEVESLVWERETTLSTGIGKGVALPHARVRNLAKPLVVVGISDTGIDFDSPDGKFANIIFLVLTPRDSPDSQITILAEIARIFRNQAMYQRVLQTKNFTDFLALIKSGSSRSKEEDLNECLS